MYSKTRGNERHAPGKVGIAARNDNNDRANLSEDKPLWQATLLAYLVRISGSLLGISYPTPIHSRVPCGPHLALP